jgi:hypothetical protein
MSSIDEREAVNVLRIAQILRDRELGGEVGLSYHPGTARQILGLGIPETEVPVAELHEMPATALTVEQEIRDRAVLHAREWHPTAGGPEMFDRAARIARFIETGSPDKPLP